MYRFHYVYAFITSRLDYCNALLRCSPKVKIAISYRVYKTRQQDLFLALESFLTLRIDYKILFLTFKCIYGLEPTYLSALISINYQIHHIISGLLVSSHWNIPRERCLQHWKTDHIQQLPQNYGMAYLCSSVKYHHLTVLNLDLRLIVFRSIFIIIYNFILYFYSDCEALFDQNNYYANIH